MKLHSMLFLILGVISAPTQDISKTVTLPMKRPDSLLTPLESVVNSIASISKLAASPTQSGNFSRPLQNVNNQLYVVSVTLGNGQRFNIGMDTGSSDTWIRGPSCKSLDSSCSGDMVDVTDSSLVSTNLTFRKYYANGSMVAGNISIAPIALGSAAVKIPIGVSTQELGFNGYTSDGLMGLGFDSASGISKASGQNANFMDALVASGQISKNIISFHLSYSGYSSGEVTFGGSDSTKFTGNITGVSVNSNSSWQFDFSKATFSINGTKGQVQGSAAGTLKNAIANTGTPVMILDSGPASAINQAIGAVRASSGLYQFPSCVAAVNAPPVNFLLAGATYSIPASIYVITSKGICFSGFVGYAKLGTAILGDVWFKSVYTIFDKSLLQIGFAQSINIKGI